MKFIYKFDGVTSPMCASSDNYDMDFDDQIPSVDMSDDDSKVNGLIQRNNLMEDLMMELSICPTSHDCCGGKGCNLKPVDTDDVVSANGHYTLEEFFNNYSEVCRNDSVDEVSETDLDFSKLFGNFDDGSNENTFQSLIDLVKCEIPVDLSTVDSRFPVEQKVENPVIAFPVKSEPSKVASSDMVQTRSKIKNKKGRKSPVLKPTAPASTKLVEKKEYVNNRKIDYGANDTIDNIYDLEWHPGFTRHLGAKGRSALLELVRRVYRQDPEHYKAILQSRNSPSSISSLPFYSIPMLWELAHQFGIFKQALTVYKNHCFSKSKSNRFYGFGRGSQNSSSSDSSENQDTDPSVKKENSQQTPEETNKPTIKTMSGRLVKRSKKIMEYTNQLTEGSGLSDGKSSPNFMDVDKPSSKLTYNHSIKDDISDNLIGSPLTKTESNENDSETPLLWKISVVNRSSNCVDEFNEGKISQERSITRRISV